MIKTLFLILSTTSIATTTNTTKKVTNEMSYSKDYISHGNTCTSLVKRYETKVNITTDQLMSEGYIPEQAKKSAQAIWFDFGEQARLYEKDHASLIKKYEGDLKNIKAELISEGYTSVQANDRAKTILSDLGELTHLAENCLEVKRR